MRAVLRRLLALHPALPALALSFGGGLAGAALGLPAGLLIGGSIAVSAAALFGVRAEIPLRLRNAALVVIGMTLGTNVQQDSLALIAQWPLTLIGLGLAVAAMVTLSAVLLNRGLGLPAGTAALAAIPGHLSFVLALAEAGGANSSRIAVIQSIRILLLTILVPVVARLFAHFETRPPLSPPATLDMTTLLPLAAACALAGWLFERARIPAGFVLGAMAVAIAAKLAGLYSGVLPFWLTATGFVVMGGLIGSRFSGVTLAELRGAALGGVTVTAASVGVVSLTAGVLAPVTGIAFGQIWIGLAPGALEAMGALGLAMGFDTGFIAAHHTARFLLISLFAPVLVAAIRRNTARAGQPG